MAGKDFNWRDHAKTSWAGSPEYRVLPDDPDLPVLDPADARRIYEAATRVEAGKRKRRWIIDHSAPLFERDSLVRRLIRLALFLIFFLGSAWLGMWWFRPDAARANRRLARHLAGYEAARAVFASPADCDGLTRAYRQADAAFVSAAGTYVRLGADAPTDQRTGYAALASRVDVMNRHFDSTGCPRP